MRSRSSPRCATARCCDVPVSVDLEKCDGTAECLKACAFNALEVRDGKCVIFENCVDCDVCVRACPTDAIISSTAPVAAGKARVLTVDFEDESGIARVAERVARKAEAGSSAVRVDVANAVDAAQALAEFARAEGVTLIILPHAGAGDAIAARLAATLNATLLAGCSDISVDEDGALRARRPRYRGLVEVTSRCSAGLTVATLIPRGVTHFAATTLATGAKAPALQTLAQEAPIEPDTMARRVVAIAADLDQATTEAARVCAKALGATVIDPNAVAGRSYAPELYVAFGVNGSTEHNTAMRGARVIVAIVEDERAPIAQIADYLLIGSVADHARALLAAL
jgi:electron transfer flavoprotein alpha subunit